MKNSIHLLNVPDEWAAGTSVLLPELDLVCDKDGVQVTVRRGEGLSVRNDENGITLTAGRKNDFFRGLSYLPAMLNGESEIRERCSATTLCLMTDCSRNAVLSVAGAKRMMRLLSLMGFDSMMLYTEDTYEIAEYPYFGRLRGRYTEQELKEMDDYADSLGIELIPCIQALAHLERALQWRCFAPISDTGEILLVGEEKTYQFIDSMLKVCRRCFRTKRINLGMDEAHSLGRGTYLAKHGLRKQSDIMLEHLGRVVDLCHENQFDPMMWSDMFFRMAFNGRYYVSEGEVPPEVIAKVPSGLTLIFWDYYTWEEQRPIFAHMLRCHLKFQNNPTAFAGGAWGWSGFTPHERFSVISSEMQLDECAQNGMTNLIVTSWGDNGRECSSFAALPTLLYFAEYSYGGKPSPEKLEKRARMLFGLGFEDFLTLDAPDDMATKDDPDFHTPMNPSKYLLYNDPLEGLMDAHMRADRIASDYAEAEKRLLPYVENPDFGYIYRTLAMLCHVLKRKADLSVRIRNAYLAGDRKTLADISAEIPVIVSDLDEFLVAFRKQWFAENKPNGFSVQEIRIGGLRARLLSASERIDEYLAGKAERIPELEEPVLPRNCAPVPENPYISFNNWGMTVTTCIL